MERKKRLGEAKRKVSTTLNAASNRELSARSNARLLGGEIILAAGMLWLVFAAVPLIAKKSPPPTKTVRGQVLDDSGSGITGAAVEMTDLTTGKKTAIYTQDGGRFLFADLRPSHDYQFRATYQGKQSEIRKVSSLDVRLRMVVNLHIPPPKD